MRYHRRYRLTDNARFSQIKKDGDSWVSSRLVLCTLPNDLDHSRFGIAVGKRIGKAVVRNRLKRLIREAVRLHLAQIVPGWDIVIIARSSARQASFHTIDAQLKHLLRRAGLWQETVNVTSQKI